MAYELWCKATTTQLDECPNNREYRVSNNTLSYPAIAYCGYKSKQGYAKIIVHEFTRISRRSADRVML
jgi:hypothetical protein